MIIGGAVITNGKTKANIIVENAVPILREKDIMSAEKANSPARRVYFTIQLMYIDNIHLATHHSAYWKLVRELIDAAPSAIPMIDQINDNILKNKYYQALKECKGLIDYETALLEGMQS